MMLLRVPDVLLTRNLANSGPLLVLIPGWAGLGAHLLTCCPYVGPTVSLSYTDVRTLAKLTLFLKDYDQYDIVIVAFSYGGFSSLSLLMQFKERILHYYLVGVCSHYATRKLNFIRCKIQDNYQQYLKRFYESAMTESHFCEFLKYGFNEVISFFSEAHLLKTLDHLGMLFINESLLKPYSITFIQGQTDAIASFNSVQQLADTSKSSLIRVSDAGHFPFYSSLFWKALALHCIK